MAADDHEDGIKTSELAASTPKNADVAAGSAASPALSEWTASDARGGLNEVGATPLARDPGEPAAVHEFADRPGNPEPVSDPVSDTVPETTPPSTRRRASLWPVAAGLVLGAAIGAGSAYYVYANGTANGDLDQRIAALTSRVDALDRRPDAQQPLAALKASVADLSTKVAALQARPQAPQAVSAAAPPATAPAPAPDVSGITQQVAALQTALETLQHRTASSADVTAVQGRIATVAAGLADIQKQTVAARDDVQSLQSGQKNLEGRITSAPALAVVAGSLVEQINRGVPFATQVSALDTLGGDPAKIAVLRQFADAGVPSATILAVKFEPLADGILAAGTAPPSNSGLWDRLKSEAGGLVSIHRVDDVQGDDLPSRVARIKADLARNDVVDAVATWAAIPAAARSKPEQAAWGALAKTHAEAIKAADDIEHDAITALAAKKS